MTLLQLLFGLSLSVEYRKGNDVFVEKKWFNIPQKRHLFFEKEKVLLV